MTGPVIAGLVTAGVVLALLIGLTVHTVSATNSAMERYAHRFARSVDLALPRDLALWVGSRARVRGLAELVVLGSCSVGLAYWLAYSFGRSWDSVASPWPALALFYWALSVILGASAFAGHEYEWRRTGPGGTAATQSQPTPRGAGFTPPAMTWLVRGPVALGFGSALVVVATDSAGSRGWRWAMIVLAAAMPVILVISEAAQRRVVCAPRLGSTDREFLFDDAFRARTVQTIAIVPIATSFFGAAFIAVAHQPADSLLTGLIPIGSPFLLLLMTSARARWMQRYFRRYWIRTERAFGQ